MKVIFLDIDGVLVNRKSLMLRSGSNAMADPECVAALNSILDRTGALIVVSSTWRIEGLMPMRERLYGWGVKTRTVLSITPRLETSSGDITLAVPRGREIQTWLNRMEALREVESFVILDDDSDMEHLTPHLVKTDFERGLTMADAERAIALLEAA